MIKQPITGTIDARIVEISEEGEVAHECALVRVFIERVDVSVRDSIILQPGRAKALFDSLGFSNYHKAVGAIVNASYVNNELKELYVRANPEWQ